MDYLSDYVFLPYQLDKHLTCYFNCEGKYINSILIVIVKY